MILYRNGRRAYSSRNFRNTDGKWEWQTMQSRWRSEGLITLSVVTDHRTVLNALSGQSPLIAVLGGFDEI